MAPPPSDPVDVAFVDRIDDPAALAALLGNYFVVILDGLGAIGGPVEIIAEAARDPLAGMAEMLPPEGRLALAHGRDGRLLGCGGLRRIGAEAVEMKRLFVRPEAQGTGLGRKLFEMRMDEARRMGCRAVYADTMKGNRSMLTIYERYGFRYVPRYPGNANPLTLDPFLVYLEFRFPET